MDAPLEVAIPAADFATVDENIFTVQKNFRRKKKTSPMGPLPNDRISFPLQQIVSDGKR
jgi:hypothetical protein